MGIEPSRYLSATTSACTFKSPIKVGGAFLIDEPLAQIPVTTFTCHMKSIIEVAGTFLVDEPKPAVLGPGDHRDMQL